MQNEINIYISSENLFDKYENISFKVINNKNNLSYLILENFIPFYMLNNNSPIQEIVMLNKEKYKGTDVSDIIEKKYIKNFPNE